MLAACGTQGGEDDSGEDQQADGGETDETDEGTEDSGDEEAAVADVEFPPSSLQYVIAFDPGGESDITARLQQQALEEAVGADVVINYQPGGGGALAWSELVNMQPDGTTIMGHNLPHIILQPMLREDAGYETDQIKQAYIFEFTPNALMVPEGSPYETLEDFIAAAEETPGALTVGGSGDFTANHLGTLMLSDQAGVELTYTPFSGTGSAVPALLGQHVTALMTYTPQMVELEDQARPLAVASEERLEQFPDVPTFTELGYDIVDGAYRGVAMPPDTPDEVVQQVADVFAEVNADPGVQEQMRELAFEIEDLGPEESEELTAERAEVYEELLNELGLLE
ncbi:MAG: tripartite tricarboxylate transporter substrate binding protein [Nitriliruptorales bacterium]|nr:tripartite tricarboxylate transporter substrate binding protein [Nitriliruptorales bacterium]